LDARKFVLGVDKDPAYSAASLIGGPSSGPRCGSIADRWPKHPSIGKEDRAQPCAHQKWRDNRLDAAVAFELAFDGPHDGQHNDDEPLT
jgi:hypothetical protein